MAVGEPLLQQAASLEDEFMSLVCSDEELLRAEFEQIVASLGEQPPDHARPRFRSGDAKPDSHPQPVDGLRFPVGRTAGLEIWARTRSPPAV